jgi:hypothetical protein
VEVFFWYPVCYFLSGLSMCAFAAVVVIKKLGRVGFKKQIRVILYLIYNFCAKIWIVFYHFYLAGRRTEYEDATAWWGRCSATSIDPCDPHGTIEYSLYSSQPLCLALILLTDSEIWYFNVLKVFKNKSRIIIVVIILVNRKILIGALIVIKLPGCPC